MKTPLCMEMRLSRILDEKPLSGLFRLFADITAACLKSCRPALGRRIRDPDEDWRVQRNLWQCTRQSPGFFKIERVCENFLAVFPVKRILKLFAGLFQQIIEK